MLCTFLRALHVSALVIREKNYLVKNHQRHPFSCRFQLRYSRANMLHRHKRMQNRNQVREISNATNNTAGLLSNHSCPLRKIKITKLANTRITHANQTRALMKEQQPLIPAPVVPLTAIPSPHLRPAGRMHTLCCQSMRPPQC